MAGRQEGPISKVAGMLCPSVKYDLSSQPVHQTWTLLSTSHWKPVPRRCLGQLTLQAAKVLIPSKYYNPTPRMEKGQTASTILKHTVLIRNKSLFNWILESFGQVSYLPSQIRCRNDNRIHQYLSFTVQIYSYYTVDKTGILFHILTFSLYWSNAWGSSDNLPLTCAFF